MAIAFCPGCGTAMQVITLPARYGREVEVDSCEACGGLWFDGLESQQLTPESTLHLLECLTLTASRPWQARSACPRCRQTLLDVHDQQRATRFTYRRCPSGHGRFISAYQFLREKHLVRELTRPEIEELRHSIRQVNCVNCGGPVSVGVEPTCPHCGTPVSMVDPNQLRRELTSLKRASQASATVDPTLPMRLARERAAAEQTWAALPDSQTWMDTLLSADSGRDIVSATIRLLAKRL
jgi:hypothetical protein